MNLATALSGVLTERNALQQPEGISLPSYISEHMQRLSQFTSALDICVGEEEKKVAVQEAELFKKYKGEGMSVNAAQNLIKYDLASERAEIVRLRSLVSSSWRFIGASQSRVKHLVEEAKNTI